MKPSIKNPLLSSALFLTATLPALATDLYWDADGATTGTGNSATTADNAWDTTSSRWRSGSDVGALQTWSNGTSPYNTAVFGDTAGNVALNSNVILNQIKFLVGGNSSGIYNIGQSGSGTITFGGSYSSTTPTIDATGISNVNGSATITAKITGTITGGLYIKANNKMSASYTTGSVGRIYLTNATTNDFIGDVTIDGGSLHSWSSLGHADNKIILKNGGGLYGNSGADVNYDINRDIVVSDGGGAVGSYASGGKTVITKLASGKTISGSGNLTRYQPAGINGTEEVWLLGGMSDYTGTFENVAGTTLIQTASTSDGAWKLTGGIIKLNTTNDTHIADGAGKSDLLMNGGTLDMNGKSETINGLSGLTGTVQNQLDSTTSTLTLGAGDATVSFGGVLRNNTTSGGTLALIKTGSGTQTLGGTNIYSGATTVNAGTLKVTGSISGSVVTVNNSGTVLASGATGAIGKGVTVNSGAILAAGGKNTVGTATVGSDGLSFASGSIFDWDLTTVTNTYDTVSVTGTLAITSGAKFNVVSSTAFSDAFWNATHTWSDIFGAKTIDNFLVSNFLYSGSATAPSTEGFFTVSGSSLTWTAVPEPTSALAGLLITAGLLRRRR